MERCPLCGSTSSRLRYEATIRHEDQPAGLYRCTSPTYGVHGAIHQCRDCRLVYLVDEMGPDAIHAEYESVEDPDYLAEESGRRATFGRYLRQIGRREPLRGKLLEIGAYAGLFLAMARDDGWEVEGIEPSVWAAAQARRLHGLELRRTVLEPDCFPEASFDAVVLWDVIEHFADPVGALHAVRGFLKPGGLLGMSTVDVASMPARVSGAKWPWFMNMHRVYFSRRTMRRALAEAGFGRTRFRAHVRWVSVRYLTERMSLHFPRLGGACARLSRALHADDLVVPFYIGDLFEVYARAV